MPRRPPAPTLIAGPYTPPRIRRGRILYDLIRGDVAVIDTSDAPIPWPLALSGPNARAPLPVLTEELARAVRTESVAAIVHHWGVSRRIVSRWRRALAVPRMTEGTAAMWRELAPRRLSRAARSKGGRASLAARSGRRLLGEV